MQVPSTYYIYFLFYCSYLSRPLPVIEGQNTNPSYGLQRKNMVQNKTYDSMPMTNHKSPNNDLVLPPPPNYLHSTQNQQINRPPPPYKGMHIISKTKFLILVYYFQYTNFLMHYIFLVVYLLYVPRALYYQTIFVHYFQGRIMYK